MCINIYSVYSDASILGAYIFAIVISSWIDPLSIMEYPTFSLVTVFVLKSILSDTSIAIPAFFLFLFTGNTFFHPPAFSLFLSLALKWVSYKILYIYLLFFYSSSHSVSLIGPYSLFTFKVIIDRYVHIPFCKLFWGFWGFFSFSFVFFLCDLMTIFSIMFKFLSSCIYVYYKFLLYEYCEVYISQSLHNMWLF